MKIKARAMGQATPSACMATPREGIGAGARAARPTPTILVREVCLRIKSKWSIMNNARNLEPDQRLKAAEFNIAMGDWVYLLAP